MGATELNHAETRMSWLTQALDQSPASTVITGLDGTIEYVNRRFSEITGYAPEEAIGKNPRLLKSGLTSPEIYRELWETIAAGRIWRGELQNRRKSGEPYWVAASISPLRRADGSVSHYLSIQEDVTERKRAQGFLEASEGRCRKLIETTFDAILITEDGIIREGNEGLARIFGYTRDEALGRPVDDFVAARSKALVQQMVAQRAEGTFEIVGRCRDGTEVLLEATSRRYDAGGRDECITALRDVTEKRDLERQLRQAQKMEAIGQLTGGLAHDFNNVLAVVISYAAMLADDLPQGDHRRADLLEIKAAGERAASLTRQLLAFSRRQMLRPELCDLNQVVGAMEKMLRRLIREDIELAFVVGGEPAIINADVNQIEQVVMNLAVNARDAMPDGGRLTIEVGQAEVDESYAAQHLEIKPGRYVVLSVTDTGCGMDRATQSHIFEPFFTTKEVGRGTGLGLSTVFGIVRQSGGHISVYSEVAHGTIFKVHLPWVSAGGAPLGRVAEERVQDLRGAETVLLVEDEEMVRRLARTILERNGYRVVEASSARDALRMAEQHRGELGLLLTDLIMPRMSGLQVAASVRSICGGELPVVYMSGYSSRCVAENGSLPRDAAFVQKPFTSERLLRKIRETLDR